VVLKSRWQVIRVKLITASHQTVIQGLVVDVREPLQTLMPYALKRFQLDAQADQYTLLVARSQDKKDVLSLDKSLLDLDINPDLEFVLINKSQPLPDAKAAADHHEKNKGPGTPSINKVTND